MISSAVDDPEKVQLNGRYPSQLAAEARRYALAHELSLNVVMCCALAEYLAKRRSGDVDPAPQLHYERGRPSRAAAQLQRELMRRDPRGRKLRERTWVL